MTYDYYDPDEAERRFDADMEQLDRIAELESLVRDIWTFYHMPTPYMPEEIAIRMTVEESLIERVAALGLPGGDAE